MSLPLGSPPTVTFSVPHPHFPSPPRFLSSLPAFSVPHLIPPCPTSFSRHFLNSHQIYPSPHVSFVSHGLSAFLTHFLPSPKKLSPFPTRFLSSPPALSFPRPLSPFSYCFLRALFPFPPTFSPAHPLSPFPTDSPGSCSIPTTVLHSNPFLPFLPTFFKPVLSTFSPTKSLIS